MIIKPTITPLNTTTFVPVYMTACLSKRDIAVFVEGKPSFIIAVSEAGEAAVTIAAGDSLSFKNIDTHGPVLYAKATAGTPNLYLFAGSIT